MQLINDIVKSLWAEKVVVRFKELIVCRIILIKDTLYANEMFSTRFYFLLKKAYICYSFSRNIERYFFKFRQVHQR